MKATLVTALVGATAVNATSFRHAATEQHLRPESQVFDRSLHRANPAAATASNSRVFGTNVLSTAAAAKPPVVGGAYLSSSDITSVKGRFTVPNATQPTRGAIAGQDIEYGASFWVGIDGVNCTTGTLRAGIDIFWSSRGDSYHAWYQVSADSSKDFLSGEIDVAPGDELRITATATGGNGTLVVNNRSTNQTVERHLAPGEKLCRSEAAWLIEDFVLVQAVGAPIALVNFTEVAFDDMKTTMQCGSSGRAEPVDLDQVKVMDVEVEEQGGKLTDCQMTGDDQMTCKRFA
ncbi:hypothetical protein MCOR25_002188 [Pyricularia grisea]|uniref:Aspergillopepsin-2 n=1 Tax=Pyricularia grisea TaxID=148305 RepID=A0A6P8AXG6_PYRGI|nr:hypothetical protein PgNI_10949 [Pyricularia grisea]KAI6378485.1 hypothetical protein MCOR25_002188 [Pyricularia grisea]TLD07027.1 hypothetical protein PgNI_10949 [Pyricularia grisea]